MGAVPTTQRCYTLAAVMLLPVAVLRAQLESPIDPLARCLLCLLRLLRAALDSGRSVHLATWGSARLEGGGAAGSMGGGQVDFALCIPADTLSMLGLKGLPEEFGVPLYLRGSLEAPRLVGVARWVDWARPGIWVQRPG